MGKMELDDFIKYAKEKFGCEVSVKMCEKPDTLLIFLVLAFLMIMNIWKILMISKMS